MASREAIKFNEVIIRNFIIKVLGVETYLITDDSFVSDFLPLLAEQGTQIDLEHWEFEITRFDLKKARQETNKNFFELSKEEREQYKITEKQILHKEELVFTQSLIDKIKEVFGVEVSPDILEKSVVEAGFIISSLITPENRIKLL